MLRAGDGPELARAADLLVRDHLAARPGEAVLITADTATDMRAAEALFRAAGAAGAEASLMVLPQLPFQGALGDPFIPEPVRAAARACDLWLDLTFPYLAGSHCCDEALAGNRLRYLLFGDAGAGGLTRLYGKIDLDRLFEAQAAIDAAFAEGAGKPWRIANRRGTDVRFVAGKPPAPKPRVVDRPGLMAVAGSALVLPEPDTVRGTIAVDAIFHEHFATLRDPLVLEVDGRIRAVSGGGADRRVAERALRRAGGGELGQVIHFTCGFHPAAITGSGSFIEDIRVIGNDAIGLGLPWWVPGGGENHPDAVVTEQSIWIDGRPVMEDGRFVDPPELARLMAALAG